MKFNVETIFYLVLALMIGLAIGFQVQAYPTEPSNWTCDDSTSGLQPEYKICKVNK